MDKIKRIKTEKKRWEEEKLNKKPYPPAQTTSGIDLKVAYTPDDIGEQDYMESLGFPGDFPYTRGVYPSMYRGQPWSMRQYAGFADPEESNKRYKYLLENGQTGLSVAFDLPTQLGYDSDHPLGYAEVGKVGVAIDSLRDMETLFNGIPLDKITTSMTINAPATILLAMYLCVAEKQGVPWEKVGGTVQNEIIKEFLARGTYVFPPKPSLRLVVDLIEFAMKEVPRFNTINISGYHVREAGANAIQEIAYCLSNAITYIEEVLKRGIDIDSFAPRLAYHLVIGLDFFEEVAKVRACRRLWAHIVKERFKAKDPRSMMFRFFCGPAPRQCTSVEPLNNIIRGTIDMMAVACSGAQAASNFSYDEAYSIPTEESALIALRTQQIVAYETGLTKVADPLGGSYYLESLTNELETRIRDLMEKIEADGGILELIEKGVIQHEVQKSAYEEELKKQKGEIPVVGVSIFPQKDYEEMDVKLERVDPKVRKKQIDNLNLTRQNRDNEKVREVLEKLRENAQKDVNLMPAIIDAVREYATIGEIMGVFREEFGEFKDIIV
ncbi:MAG TPA: methylmalonyl-CoA mutase family protein [Syntrophales bacterium]|nr:methylmalonyl-CoA mutase family protein [Syntrophales bacterium]